MYYDVGDRIKIEFLAPRVVQAKFREIAKTITKPRFSIFLAISRTPKKMSEPGVMMRQMCEPYYGDRVIAWPVGIATDEWIPSSSKDKDIDFLLNSEDFAARDYILENLTLEKCAQNYLDILFSQQ